MRRIVAIAVLVAGLAAGGRALAEDDFAAGNRAYAEGRFEDAIARYEALATSGLRHPSLYVNLGSAYYRAGKLGPAILNFERALSLASDDDDARFDLEVARDAVAARWGKDAVAGADKDPLWMRAVQVLPLATLSWLFLAIDVFFFGLLIALRFLPTGFLRTGLLVGNVFVGISGAAIGVLLAGQLYLRANVRMSVVVADQVVMREGPDHTRREMPRLHAGHRVVIVRESEGWVRIRLANRVEGWVPKGTVEGI